MTVRRRFVLPLSFALAACASSKSEEKPAAAAAAPAPAPDAGSADAGVAAAPAPKQLTLQAFASSEDNGAVNSYLLTGETDALLIDAQLVNSEAQKLAAMIKASGKMLRTIYITHAHPDHFVGLTVLKKEFPDAQIVAKKRVVEAMPVLFKKFQAPLNKFFPNDIPTEIVVPTELAENSLSVEGIAIEILEFEGGESEYTTALKVPSMKTLFIADVAYNKVHPWLNELRFDGVLKHVEALRAVEGVDALLPGHGAPMTKEDLAPYEAYVKEFLVEAEKAKDAKALVETMKTKYPDYKALAGLRFSANAQIDAREEAKKAAKKKKK